MGLCIWLITVSVNGKYVNKTYRNIVINYLVLAHDKRIIAQCITVLNRMRIG